MTDMNGVELRVGQNVLIHYEDGNVETAIIRKLFPDQPTVLEPGFWVDIETSGGFESMMSYMLEVVE